MALDGVIAYSLYKDRHVHLVSDALIAAGAPVYYIDPFEASGLVFGDDETPRCRAMCYRKRELVELDMARHLVWMRSKATVAYIQTADDQILYFRERENRAFMTGLCLSGAVRHTNPWASLAAHENKLVQHTLARAAGFTMPRTLFSSSEPAIRDLLQDEARVVSKPISTGLIPRPRLFDADEIMMMTNRFDKSRLNQPGYSTEIAPVIYQAEVEKKCEMRVLATRREVRAYRLRETVAIPGAQVDWRRAQAAITGEPAEVPKQIGRLCGAYLRAAGLDYGVMDFIIDTDGRWIFLECNGDGQWVFIEREAGPFTAAMAEMLIERLDRA